jgi:hypothetical protein
MGNVNMPQVCSTDEWQTAAPAVSLQGVASALSYDTEKKIEALLRELCRCELDSKVTTLDDDEQVLVGANSKKGFKKGASTPADYKSSTVIDDDSTARQRLAIAFRIEKKKLLVEAIRT